MLNFEIVETENYSIQDMTCQCCFKKHKAKYKVKGISRPGHINWISDFVCSKECAEMYILQHMDGSQNLIVSWGLDGKVHYEYE